MGCVYLVRNLLNGKGYVGKTKGSLLCRQIGHLRDAIKGSEFLLHRALRKYGPDAFEWRVLMHSDDLGDLNESEIVMIKALKARSPIGYNLTDGGDGGDTFSGKSHSEEAKEKIRKAKTPEIIKRVANFHRGRKRSLKTRLAISRAMIGRTAWNKGKKGKKTGRSSWNKGLPAWNRGKFPSEETRAKMRDSAKKRFENPEQRRKISETKRKQGLPSPMKGRKHTKEAIEKNRQAHLGVKHSPERVQKNREAAKHRKRDEYSRFLPKEKTVA